MIPEIGHFAIVVALVVALAQSILPLAGAATGNRQWMSVARPAAWAQFGFLLLSFLMLIYCFLDNDFTVKYVANHSNTYLPPWFKVSAVWGGHEGSLLLWALVLSGWTASVALFSRNMPLDMMARVLGIMGLIAIGFYSFLLFTSNPFQRLLPDLPPDSTLPDFAVDGADLNPLLQDFGLIVHPPMLYMGYVGFSVAFAFAIAGLLSGQLDSAWARWSRPWTTVAWCFLTVGIALGSWWAYYELGWGGWWFWDPVENASFMPWLSGTALIHSLAATEKRGVFKAWTVLLAIFTFSLSLLGTFLVRSGVLTSVHAFASDPERGLFILIFLLLVVGGSLLLFAIRAQSLHAESRFQLLSREVFILINNLILILATLVVLVGTLFPILFDVFGLGKISVGPPYFNTLFMPVAIVLMCVMGIGPLLNWKKHDPQVLLKKLPLVAVASVLLAVGFLFSLGFSLTVVTVISVSAGFWVIGFTFKEMLLKMAVAKAGLWAGFQRLSLSYKGMVLAHIGLAITVVGITVVASSDVERDVRLSAGESLTVDRYRFLFKGVQDIRGPNYTSVKGEIAIYENEKLLTVLYPEKRQYLVQRSVMTEAAIHPSLMRDIYVALGEPLGDGSWAVRVYYKPLMRWVWGGGVIMALGGLVAMSDRRYRLKMKRKASASISRIAGERI